MKIIKYSEQQESAINRLLEFLESDEDQISLEGPPGVGKSTILQAVVRRTKKVLMLTAPTNKATRVVRRMAADELLDVECRTTYSALGLQMSTDDEIKQVFQREAKDILEDVDCLVVDECSMVGIKLYQYIIAECKSRGIKVIFVGDRYQIPPVGEAISQTFLTENIITLTKNERVTEGNPILQVVTNIRECIDLRQYPRFTTAANDGLGVYTVNYDNFTKYMKQGFASDTYKNKEDSFKCVAWRNDTVDYNNRNIRTALYGKDALQPFVLGEKVVAAGPINPPADDFLSDRMCTDDEGTIIGLNIGDHPLHPSEPFKVWHLQIAFEGGMVTAYVLHEDERPKMEAKLVRMAASCKAKNLPWKVFWDFKDSFHDVRPCHAITAHRSQGSTYENTFVDVNDILANRDLYEGLRILYVACSRSSHRLILRTA